MAATVPPPGESAELEGAPSHLGMAGAAAGVTRAWLAPPLAGLADPSSQGAAHKGLPELAPFPGESFCVGQRNHVLPRTAFLGSTRFILPFL